MHRHVMFLSVAALLCGAVCQALSAEQPRETELASGVVEKVYPDGRRTIVAGGRELADRTPPPQPKPPSDDLGPDESARGFVLYRRAASGQVFRRSAPKLDEHVAALSTAVSLGEKRHVQFAVYALRDLGRVDVSAGSLADANGQTLPADVLVVRPVRIGFWQNYWDPWFQEAPKLIDAPDSRAEAAEGVRGNQPCVSLLAETSTDYRAPCSSRRWSKLTASISFIRKTCRMAR